jgi:radical SAM superfamily enzyme YgiQ (UPF0313 family)
MKVLLVNSPPLRRARWGEPQAIYPPLGILYLASYLRKYTDVSLKIVDGAKNGFKRTLKKIKKSNFDLLGISFTTWAATGAYNLINTLKEKDPDIFVIAGGAHPSALPFEVLKESRADMVAIGEGEQTMLEIVRNFGKRLNLNKIDGIVFRKGKKCVFTRPRKFLNVNSIPFPARDLIDIKSYEGLYWSMLQPETNIISSRGCPFHCTFCSNPVWRANKPLLRLRDPKNIGEEIRILRDNFGIREISDEADTFNVDLNWAIKVCNEIKEVGIPWKVQIRANPFSEKLAKEMAKSGCWLVRIGIESGNLETLKGIKKGITLKQVINTCRKLKKYDIKVVGLFMIFNVWEENGRLRFEDMKMCENTFKFVAKLLREKLIDSFSWHFTTPFPGSELYSIAKKYGLIEGKDYERWNQASNFIMNLPGITRKNIEKIKMKGIVLQAKSMFKPFWFNPRDIYLYFQRVLLFSKMLIDQFI